MPNSIPTTLIKILIIDDDEDDYLITGEYIRQIPGATFQIDWCYRYEEALDLLCEANYDIYFTDFRLGAKSGLDLLKESKGRGCNNPVVLLTGKGNRDVDFQAMQHGAVDYLIKTELSVEKMERCIRYALERAATLRALKANEKKFRSIFEKSKDLIFLTDTALKFQDCNDAANSLFGYTCEAMLDMNLCDLVSQAQHKKFMRHALQRGNNIDDLEAAFLTSDGKVRICMLSASQEIDNDGVPYVQGIIHDITALRKEERSTLLAEKLAANGRLIRTLAHEVRNPLNNITLSVEQLQQEDLGEESKFYLDIVQRNAIRISTLITELLNTSRPADITLVPDNLQGIVDEVIASSIDRMTLKRIKLTVSYPNELISIKADRPKLILALLNIFINAIEAMEEQVGKLEISIHLNSGIATLIIKDNGCGILEENISRLFEPYFTQKRNGMGLGLAFTLSILQAHKASVDVASGIEEGTQFSIAFPIIH